jgi:hypothetical protein
MRDQFSKHCAPRLLSDFLDSKLRVAERLSHY